MNIIEVVVNVPIRRTFRRDQNAPPPDDNTDAGDALQTYHYHLPPELESIIEVGHLVWAPFGAQEVQAVVLRRVASAPVPTKPILRLARPEPVLTAAQIELAAWIADRYVAPFVEAIRLCLPPGLLSRTPGQSTARSRREMRIELTLPAAAAREQLLTLGRASGQAGVLQWLLAHHPATPTVAELQAVCHLRSDSAIQSLRKLGAVSIEERQVTLRLDDAAAMDLLLTLRGVDKYRPIIDTLAAAGRPLWRHELHALTPAPLPLLRELQAAGIVTLREEIVLRDPLSGRVYPVTEPLPLTSEQTAVWQRIVTEGLDKRGAAFLLHGVTGSGKTEIYLRAIAAVIQRQQQAIVLVPEIALTPQTVARFAGRFPGRVTVIHSALSTGERYDIWRAIRAGHYDVIIGPRSALFAPTPALGLIIIDEEHEGTYKQDAEVWGGANVFYDARTVARHMAATQGCLLIAGSATPSLESYLAAQQGEMILLEMTQRVMGHRSDGATLYSELPPIEVVDMRQELRAGNRSIFSRSLSSQLLETLAAGEQAILFLNRRGANTFILCRDCGYVAECKRCAVPLTYHTDAAGNAARLVCHHCNRVYPVPEACPVCKSKRIRFFGAGTERVEEAVKEILPTARVLRWDADTTVRKGSHEQIMTAFASHAADILIGTQMIAKGLDLPLVTLVGVVSADIGLFLPDFRSSERTFQLLTQVAGRAGRSARGGRVVIQSYRPDHYVIQAAARHDYHSFYARELDFRREHGYPPVRRLARLVYWEKRLERVKQETQRMAAVVRQRLETMGLEGQVASLLGPAPAFFERYRGYYRWQLLLRAPDPAVVLRGVDIPFGWRVDIDPVSLL
ncbi:MAG TPA: primosomal protein N' [Chloroflexi bacterium]|nr:primosomal protein N' [Chloroflexota bacterium]HHW86913.1 primosomal protein N' [Chloroflexota bacterium]